MALHPNFVATLHKRTSGGLCLAGSKGSRSERFYNLIDPAGPVFAGTIDGLSGELALVNGVLAGANKEAGIRTAAVNRTGAFRNIPLAFIKAQDGQFVTTNDVVIGFQVLPRDAQFNSTAILIFQDDQLLQTLPTTHFSPDGQGVLLAGTEVSPDAKLTAVGFIDGGEINETTFGPARVQKARVDLVFQRFPTDDQEENGALLKNDDDDDGDRKQDDEDDEVSSEEVSGDDDLISVRLDVTDNVVARGGALTLLTDKREKIRFWADEKKTPIFIEGEAQLDAAITWSLPNQRPPETVYIEGVETSDTAGDVTVELRYSENELEPLQFQDNDTAQLTVIDLRFLENQNLPIGLSQEALNVSNFVTTDDSIDFLMPENLPTDDDTSFTTTSNDPDNFRLEVIDPSVSSNAVSVQVQVPSGSFNYTLEDDSQNAFRSPILRLVSDAFDDGASGHGETSDPDDQTILVALGDEATATYNHPVAGSFTRKTSVGRPVTDPEDNNELNQRRHDIRVLNVRIVVFETPDGGAPAFSPQAVSEQMRVLEERLAQATIQVNFTEVDFGPDENGAELPEELEDDFDIGNSQGPNGDELALSQRTDGNPNSIDVFFVDRSNDFLGEQTSATAYPQVRFPLFVSVRNFIVVPPFELTPQTLGHEVMHILLNAGHRIGEAPTSLFFGGSETEPSDVITGAKRIGPYPPSIATPGASDDTFDIRRSAEALPR